MNEAKTENWAILVAAGRGTRAGGDIPKQWQGLGEQRVIDHALAAFARHPRIDGVVIVHHPDDAGYLPTGYLAVPGGQTRGGSVLAGLEALADHPVANVLIHDAARPCVSAHIIDDVLDALADAPGAAPALPVTDALWVLDGAAVTGTQPRDALARAQTPQGFHYDAIRAAHAAASGDEADDVQVALAAGLDVVAVNGDEDNIKITRPGDVARAERILGTGLDIRCGNGYDVHRFGPGDHVVLCGVTIPHGRGLQGHSDADVGMHALTDAIYGALAEGDIGRHFPPSDPQWKGADSAIFLAHAANLARARGFDLSNADVTLVCEQPKIGPHAAAMQDRLAEIIGAEPGRISVKATTSERLGFTGREEGIAALATVTLMRR